MLEMKIKSGFGLCSSCTTNELVRSNSARLISAFQIISDDERDRSVQLSVTPATVVRWLKGYGFTENSEEGDICEDVSCTRFHSVSCTLELNWTLASFRSSSSTKQQNTAGAGSFATSIPRSTSILSYGAEERSSPLLGLLINRNNKNAGVDYKCRINYFYFCRAF